MPVQNYSPSPHRGSLSLHRHRRTGHWSIRSRMPLRLCVHLHTHQTTQQRATLKQPIALIEKTEITAKVSSVLVCRPFNAMTLHTQTDALSSNNLIFFFSDAFICARLQRSSSFLPFRDTLGLKTGVFFKQRVCEMVELGCKHHPTACKVSGSGVAHRNPDPTPGDNPTARPAIQPPPLTLTRTAQAPPRPCGQKGIFPSASAPRRWQQTRML